MDNLSTRTPAEIDGEIARISSLIARFDAQATQANDTIERIRNAADYERSYPWNSQEARDKAAALLNEAMKQIDALEAEVAPLHAEFDRRPWTRFYLVTNSNGHVHSTTSCDTCFPTTSFAWLTQYSGSTHDEIVDLAGEKACTVCFPNAPVDALRRKSRISTPEQEARRVEKARKQAEKEAAQVVVENYIEYGGRPRTRVFKSDRAATNDIANHLTSLAWYGTDHPSGGEWLLNVEATRKALEAKGVEFDVEDAKAKARKRVVKDGGEPKI